MAKIKIILWTYQANKDGTFPLRLRVWSGGRKLINTGYSVREDQWDDRLQEVKKNYPNHKWLNNYLQKKKSDATDESLQMELLDEKTTAKQIGERLKKQSEPKVVKPPPKKFTDFCDERIARELKTKEIAHRTTGSHYSGFVNRVRQYEKDKSLTIYCEELTEKLLEDYFIWYRTASPYVKSGRLYEENSVNSEKKYCKKFAFAAKKEFKLELTVSGNVVLRKKRPKDKPIVYLTVPELQRLKNLGKTDFKKIGITINKNGNVHKPKDEIRAANGKTYCTAEITRDYFLVVAYTGGVRIADYSTLNIVQREDNQGYYFPNISKKTNTFTKNPCFPFVVDIWRKYAVEKNGKLVGSMPAVPVKFNKLIKELCKAAKINAPVLLNKEGDFKPKWEVVRSHCARKSFCSNMVYHFNQPQRQVMAWAGITSTAIFEAHYIGKDIRDNFDSFDAMIQKHTKMKIA